MSSRKNFFIKAESFSNANTSPAKGVNDNTGTLSKKAGSFLQSLLSGGRSFLVILVIFLALLMTVFYLL